MGSTEIDFSHTLVNITYHKLRKIHIYLYPVMIKDTILKLQYASEVKTLPQCGLSFLKTFHKRPPRLGTLVGHLQKVQLHIKEWPIHDIHLMASLV